MFKSIENSKTISLEQFLYALAIPGVGYKNAKELALIYETKERFCSFIKRFKNGDLCNFDKPGTSWVSDYDRDQKAFNLLGIEEFYKIKNYALTRFEILEALEKSLNIINEE